MVCVPHHGRSVGRSITERGQCVLTGADDADEAPSGPSLEFWTWMLLGLKRKNGGGGESIDQ